MQPPPIIATINPGACPVAERALRALPSQQALCAPARIRSRSRRVQTSDPRPAEDHSVLYHPADIYGAACALDLLVGASVVAWARRATAERERRRESCGAESECVQVARCCRLDWRSCQRRGRRGSERHLGGYQTTERWGDETGGSRSAQRLVLLMVLTRWLTLCDGRVGVFEYAMII